jgi:DNA-binding NarL/FixJ family response regulator
MKPLSLGVATADPVVGSACKEALRRLGDVCEVERDRESLARPLPFDLLVLDLGRGRVEDVALFAACLSANRELPIVLTGPDPGPDLAVELLQLGAADFTPSPPTPDTLHRKVRRLLTGKAIPAIDHPALAPLSAKEGDSDRRASYRARVSREADASVRLLLDGEAVRAAIMDLSLDGERAPGALRVRASADITAPKLWLHAGRGEHAGELLIDDDYDEAVPVRLRATRVRYSLRKRTVDVVLQYRTEGAEGSRRIGRFWIRCQRRDGRHFEYPGAS